MTTCTRPRSGGCDGAPATDEGILAPTFVSERPVRLALVTDAWHPQTNGVVNTLSRLVAHLRSQGTEVLVVAPDAHRTVPLPSYPEIRLAGDPWKAIPRSAGLPPDAVHIATEGPLGFWIRGWLGRHGLQLHHQLPHALPRVPERAPARPAGVGYAAGALVPRARRSTRWWARSPLIRELQARRVGRRLVHWPRGVDAEAFHPGHRQRTTSTTLPRPIWLYVGRVAVEKSLEDFLRLPLPGTKVVVGDGPVARGAAARASRRRCGAAGASGRSWPPTSPAPTASCSRRAPRRSAT